jgi:membrane protein
MPFITSLRIIWRACRQWVANQDARLGAALAYYALFSIAPLLIIAIHIAGLFFGEDAARGRVVQELRSLVGEDAAKTIQSLIQNADQPQAGGWATLVSFGILIIGALSIFVHMRSALCLIWKLEPPQGNSLLGVVLDYVLALAMVLCSGGLLLLSLVASMVEPILHKWMDWDFPETELFWKVLEFAISVLFLTLLFTTLFRVLSGRRFPWTYVVYGAVLTALLFSIGNIALGMYLVYTSTASMYGAAGSLVVFLIWVYYSAQILYFGAELVQARRTRQEWMGR